VREILFRGKRIDNGEWVCGDLLHEGYDYDVAIWETEGKLVTEVIPETVGQYTGLTDKKAKKIFEGDVVKILYADGFEIGAICWNNLNFRFCFNSPEGFSYGFNVSNEFEVIGNIHDNPELLKGGASDA